MSGVNWAMAVPQQNALTGFMQGMRLGTAERQAREDRAYQLSERRRQADARDARADYLLAGRDGVRPGGNALLSAVGELSQGMGAPAGGTAWTPAQPRQPSRSDAFARFARLDPEGASTLRREEVQSNYQRLRNFEAMNNLSMQWLGAVTDQQSYDQARAQSRALMERYGEDASGIDNLPAQWTPAVSERLRMQGMAAQRQLAGLLQRARLEWDIEDDEADNERADRALADVSSDRAERRRLTRRGQDMTDARGRRGQDMTDARARSRSAGGWMGGRRSGRGAETTAIGPGGVRIYHRNGRWEDERGQPVS